MNYHVSVLVLCKTALLCIIIIYTFLWGQFTKKSGPVHFFCANFRHCEYLSHHLPHHIIYLITHHITHHIIYLITSPTSSPAISSTSSHHLPHHPLYHIPNHLPHHPHPRLHLLPHHPHLQLRDLHPLPPLLNHSPRVLKQTNPVTEIVNLLQ